MKHVSIASLLCGHRIHELTSTHSGERSPNVCTKGKMHCPCLDKGKVFWTNELKGFSYGVASVCVPGYPVGPAAPAFAHLQSERRSDDDSAAEL